MGTTGTMGTMGTGTGTGTGENKSAPLERTGSVLGESVGAQARGERRDKGP